MSFTYWENCSGSALAEWSGPDAPAVVGKMFFDNRRPASDRKRSQTSHQYCDQNNQPARQIAGPIRRSSTDLYQPPTLDNCSRNAITQTIFSMLRANRPSFATSSIVAAPVDKIIGTPSCDTADNSGRFTRSGDAIFTAGNFKSAMMVTSAGENGVAIGSKPRLRISATKSAISVGANSYRRNIAAGSASATRVCDTPQTAKTSASDWPR